jgi:hypothetical protein
MHAGRPPPRCRDGAAVKNGRADELLRRLARLIGRQIAREAFDREQAKLFASEAPDPMTGGASRFGLDVSGLEPLIHSGIALEDSGRTRFPDREESPSAG